MGQHRKAKEQRSKRNIVALAMSLGLVGLMVTSSQAPDIVVSNPMHAEMIVPVETPQSVQRVAQVKEIVEKQQPVTLTKVYEAAKQIDPALTEVIVIDYLREYPLKATADLKCNEGFEPRDTIVIDAEGRAKAEPLCYKKEAQVTLDVVPSGFVSEVDIKDYSDDASDRGWGKGWPSSRDSLAFVTTDRSGTKIQVDSRIAQLVKLLLDETEKRGYLIDPRDISGYSNRPIAGTRTASNHSWGLAVDLNVSGNPQTGRLVTDMPGWMPNLWNQYGFAWGGHYSSGTLKDAMHYEFMGTPQDAAELTEAAEAEFNPVPPVIVTEPGILEPVVDIIEGVGEVVDDLAS